MRSPTSMLFTILSFVLIVGVACSTESESPPATTLGATPSMSEATAASPIEAKFPAAGAAKSSVHHPLAGSAPRAVWEPADGVALLSVTRAEAIHLGHGALGAFSPASTTVTWSDGSRLHVRQLFSGVQAVFPESGTLNGYVSDTRVLLSPASGRTILDLTDGTSVPTTKGPFELIPLGRSGETELLTDTPSTSPGLRGFTVVRPSIPPLNVPHVFAAALADDKTLLVAAPTTDQPRLANLIRVDLTTGSTELLFTIGLGQISNPMQAQVPLGAAQNRVAWTSGFCGADAQVQFMDLGDRVVHSTDLPGWVSVAPDGRLALGDGFSTTRLVDPLSGVVILEVRPPRGTGVVWDPTFTWVLSGPQAGHGGTCPGS